MKQEKNTDEASFLVYIISIEFCDSSRITSQIEDIAQLDEEADKHRQRNIAFS